jgi:hypothetical protein
MNANKKISYRNTLLYTIIAAIISLALLVLLAFQSFFEYVYLIAIIEVGIFIIIGYCIYRIVTYEKALEELKNQKRYYIPFAECPDYFVKKFDSKNGDPYCSNEYRVKDASDNMYMMKVYPDSVPLPTKHDDKTSVDQSHKYEKFWLNQVANAKELRTTKEKCSVISVEPTDPKLVNYRGYTDVPWTYVRSRCDGFF